MLARTPDDLDGMKSPVRTTRDDTVKSPTVVVATILQTGDRTCLEVVSEVGREHVQGVLVNLSRTSTCQVRHSLVKIATLDYGHRARGIDEVPKHITQWKEDSGIIAKPGVT